VNFRFNFQIDFDGINGSLELQRQTTANMWGFPQVLSEVLSKVEGLHLINGPRRSGKSAAANELLQSLGANVMNRRKKVIAVYTDNEAQTYQSKDNVVSVFPSSQLARSGVLRAADLVVIDTDRLDFCEMALRLAENGRSVLMTTAFWHLGMGIERFVDLCEGDAATKLRRFSRVFQSGLGLRLMPGIETSLQGAYELLLGTQEIKETLRLGQMETLPAEMKNNADKTGMRTLNQALFQLLLKRKIELKVAFENSSDPQELDQLLRKVGI
jgi:twitching motility protein PilT